MSADEVDAYLAKLEPIARGTLGTVRRSILAVVLDADQGLAYGAPAFAVQGFRVAGFAAFKQHLSYLPHSGSVLGGLADATAGYRASKGALQFPVDQPLPDDLVRVLVEARLREIGLLT